MTASTPDNANPAPADEPALLEEIVAYLDGELSPTQSAAVEQRLASDELYRQQLQSVDRAYNALDQLPQARVDESFARTTMEMVVTEARRDVEAMTQQLPALRRRQRWRSLLLVAAAGAAGWLLYRGSHPDPNAELVADLPVIDNVEIYSQFGEVSFLRDLHQQVGDLLTLPDGLAEPTSARPHPVIQPQTAAQRRAYLAQLSSAEATKLRAKYNRFRSLPDEEKQRLRDLHNKILEGDNPAELLETMRRYQLWLASVPPARQFELRMLPPQERVATIRSWAAEMQEEAAFKLTQEQLQKLAQAVYEPMPQLLRLLAQRGPDGNRRGPGYDRFDGERRRDIFFQAMSGEGEGPAADFYRRLLEALPEETAKAFEMLPVDKRVERFQGWMRQATALRGEVSQQELERFFAEDLDPGVREELLLLPPGEMEAALKRLYQSQSGGAWAGWGRFSRGRQGPPRPRNQRELGPDPFPGGPPGDPRGGPSAGPLRGRPGEGPRDRGGRELPPRRPGPLPGPPRLPSCRGSSPMPLLDIAHVTKTYAVTRALDDVSLKLLPGVTGLLGPNGSGKSTLIKALLGLVKVQSGQGVVLGRAWPQAAREIRDAVGYLPEDDCYMAGLAGIESAAFMARLSGIPGREALRRAHEIADFCDIGEERYREVESYSTGMRQKLKFAQALVHDPPLLILDEPTTGLDPDQRRAMLSRIGCLARDHGKSVLLSTHILPDVQAVCEQVIILAKGRVRISDTLDNLSRPTEPTVQISVLGSSRPLAERLAAEGHAATVGIDGALRVEGIDRGQIPQLWRWAAETGSAVCRLQPARNSLEKIFFDAVRGDEHASS